jgi:hypothetical protein
MYVEPTSEGEEEVTLWHKIFAYAAYLLFWVIFSAIGLWLLFDLRALVVQLMMLARLTPWAVRGYDRLAIFVLGLGWFIFILWLENYLRTAIDKRRLWRTIAGVALIQVALLALVYGLRFVIGF